MRNKFHQSSALAVGLTVSSYTSVLSIPYILGLVIGSSTIADKDLLINKSFLYRTQRTITNTVGLTKKNKRSIFTHRGITHSLIFPSILCFLVYWVLSYINKLIALQFTTGLGIGYLVHLLGDCLTYRGCPLFYPLIPIGKTINLSLIKTDSFAEHLLYILSLSYCIFWCSNIYLPSMSLNISLIFGIIYLLFSLGHLHSKKFYNNPTFYKLENATYVIVYGSILISLISNLSMLDLHSNISHISNLIL